MAATETPALTTTTAAAPAAVRLDLEVTMTSTNTRRSFVTAAGNLLVTDAMRSDLTAGGYAARKAARARGERIACAILRAGSDLAWAAR